METRNNKAHKVTLEQQNATYSSCAFILHKYNASRIVSSIHFQNANILAILCLAHLCKSRKTLVKKINSNLDMCFFFFDVAFRVWP